jgi:hypothetical protein
VTKNGLIGLAIVAASIAACSDTSAPASGLAITMASAYSATPAGFSQLSSSFAADSAAGPFQPGFGPRGHGGRDRGFEGPHGGPGFGLGFMGGGLFGAFLGDGPGGFMHDDDGSCSYSSSTGLVTCGPSTTHDGLTVTRVSKYTTAAGATQAKRDSTTNTATTTITVTGTSTRRDSSKSTVNESSTQTVTGLAKGSTQRTVNGASAGTETTTGTSARGAFTAARSTGDTVKAVVIPALTSSNGPSYPTSGTVIRAMSATITISGQSPATSSRREVITYDGSATAKVVITQDGTTQNCTLPLPHGHLTCS